MKSRLPIDELNQLQEDLIAISMDPMTTNTKKRCEDLVLDLLIMAYVFGADQANDMIGTSVQIDEKSMQDSIEATVAGKTWRQRVSEYTDDAEPSVTDVSGDAPFQPPTWLYDILRVAETEMHRIYNEAEMDTAHASGKKVSKQWVTMADEKVRDTHQYLDLTSVPLDAKFYTYDGDSALAPGGFELAENNVNCRCELYFTAE